MFLAMAFAAFVMNVVPPTQTKVITRWKVEYIYLPCDAPIKLLVTEPRWM